jgi:hypothetical protein
MTESIDLVNEMEGQLVEKQKTLYGLAVEKNGAEKHRSLLADRLRELKSKLEQLELRARSIQEKIDACGKRKGTRKPSFRNTGSGSRRPSATSTNSNLPSRLRGSRSGATTRKPPAARHPSSRSNRR